MVEIAGLLRPDGGLKARVRWHLNRWLLLHLKLMRRGSWITVHDVFGAPGDTLLTGIACRLIAERFPGLRINCITRNPELLKAEPYIARVNGPETYISLRHSYLELIEYRKAQTNVLDESMRSIGVTNYEYRASVRLTDGEKADGLARLKELGTPVISVNTRSKEPVKNWPEARWRELIHRLSARYQVIQLGDAAEPEMDGAISFAGKLGLRESMAVLAHAKAHVGPDSFLMHAANGLGVPSVILFGGSRTIANLGYAANINLFVPMACGPCYIHESRGQVCGHDVECMKRITVDEVHDAVLKIMER